MTIKTQVSPAQVTHTKGRATKVMTYKKDFPSCRLWSGGHFVYEILLFPMCHPPSVRHFVRVYLHKRGKKNKKQKKNTVTINWIFDSKTTHFGEMKYDKNWVTPRKWVFLGKKPNIVGNLCWVLFKLRFSIQAKSSLKRFQLDRRRELGKFPV